MNPASPAPQIVITGTLVTDAEWRVTSGAVPAGFVVVQLDQPGAIVIRACQPIGTDPSRMLAGQAKARAMRRGDRVKVYGTQLHANTKHIELLGVTDVIPMHVRAPATQES